MFLSTRKEKTAGTKGHYSEMAGQASSLEALWRVSEGAILYFLDIRDVPEEIP